MNPERQDLLVSDLGTVLLYSTYSKCKVAQ